jgi:hypothetical protein
MHQALFSMLRTCSEQDRQGLQPLWGREQTKEQTSKRTAEVREVRVAH